MPIPQARLIKLIEITDSLSSRVEQVVQEIQPGGTLRSRFEMAAKTAAQDPRPGERETAIREMLEIFDHFAFYILGMDLTKDEAVTIALERRYFEQFARKNEASARYQRKLRHMATSRAGEAEADQIVSMMTRGETMVIPESESEQHVPSAGYLKWKEEQEKPPATIPTPRAAPSPPKTKPNFDMTPETRALYEQQQREDAEHAASQGGDML